MDGDERQIYDFLSCYGEEWINIREICRKAGGRKRFSEDNHWADPVAQRMKDRMILEGDLMGRYRIRPSEQGHGDDEVSPDVEKILQEGGENADVDGTGTDSDGHSEQL